jgi:protein associated with RNAse G/E
MVPGNTVQVKAYKADGDLYRWWLAEIESSEPGSLVLAAPSGHKVEGSGRNWVSEYTIRFHYWLDRPYNLLEVYRASGELEELYVHIASRPEWEDNQLCYTDYELDVVYFPGGALVIDDEDEFEQAIRTYDYSPDLQRACRQAVQEAVQLVKTWTPKECPVISQ